MKRFTNTVLSEATGLAVVNATVTVFLTGTHTKAILFAADDIAGTPSPNPFVTKGNGIFAFYVADGRYDIVVTYGARTIVAEDVEIVDALGLRELIDLIPSGPANSSYASSTAVGAAAPSNLSAILVDRLRPGVFGYDATVSVDDIAADPFKSIFIPGTAGGAWVRNEGRKHIDLSWTGIPNDQSTTFNAAPAVYATFQLAKRLRRPLKLGPGEYNVGERFDPEPVTGALVGNFPVGPGYDIDVSAVTWVLFGNAMGVSPIGQFSAKTTVTAPIDLGVRTIPVTDTSGFAVGGWAHWRLGDVPFDTPETFNWGFARITAVDTVAKIITLDRYLSRRFTADELAAAVGNKHLYAANPLVGQHYGRSRFRGSELAQGQSSGLVIYNAVGVTADSVYTQGVNAVAFAAQYVDGFHVASVVSRNSRRISGNELNTGIVCRAAEAKGSIDSVEAINAERYAIYAEAASDVMIGRLHDINPIYYTDVEGYRRSCIYSGGRSRIHIEDALFEGLGAQNLFEAATGGQVTFGSVAVRCASLPWLMPMPGRDCRSILVEVAELAGVEEVYESSDWVWWEHLITLTDGLSVTYTGPAGLMSEVRVLAGGGATAASLTTLALGREGQASESLLGQVSNEVENIVLGYAGAGFAGPQFAYRNSRITLQLTAAATGLTGGGKFIRIRVKLYRNQRAPLAPVSSADVVAS